MMANAAMIDVGIEIAADDRRPKVGQKENTMMAANRRRKSSWCSTVLDRGIDERST